MLRWLWLTGLVVVLDQVSKQWLSAVLHYHEPFAVIPYFNLTLMHNSGAAFSFLADAGGWQRWFFAAVALIASTAITLWLRGLKPHQRWEAAALAMVLGGALGNLWDRLWYGYVIDFLDVYYGNYHWPAFNIADTAITIGAAMLIIDLLFMQRHVKA